MIKKENLEDICGDLHAIRIIGQTGGFPNSIKGLLQTSLQGILARLKDEFNSEGLLFENLRIPYLNHLFSIAESPPKKRKLDSSTEDDDNKEEAKIVSEEAATPGTSKDEASNKVAESPEEDKKEQNESKEDDIDGKPLDVAAVSSTSSSDPFTQRMDLIKDIESHIEIIFECLDDEISEENILISQSDACEVVLSQDGDVKESDESVERKSAEEGTSKKKPDESKDDNLIKTVADDKKPLEVDAVE